MVLMIPGRGQGFSGEVSGSLGHIIEGSLQVVELLPLAPCLLQVEPLPVPFVGLQGGDQLSIHATSQVLRRDSAPSPDGSVKVGSTIAIDEPHCTTLRGVPRILR